MQDFFKTASKTSLQTIYFGGGTPSLLTTKQIGSILSTLKETARVEKYPEISFECHPLHIAKDYINQLKILGVTRISVGAQSFNDKELQFLQRPYGTQLLQNNLSILFEHKETMQVGLDLIIGLPNQTTSDLRKNLEKLCTLQPDHCSCYFLSIDEKTKFGVLKKKKELLELDEETARSLYLFMHSFLEEKGYEHYEISNWAKNKSYCRHNKAVWSGEAYKGFGVGAYSYFAQAHRSQSAHLSEYLAGKREEEIYPCKTKVDLLSVSLLGTTRTLEGIPKRLFDGKEETVEQLCKQGYLKKVNDQYISTPEGWLVNDAVVKKLYEKLTD
jgi:oxygen-independent coproporphyrinogen-3 oxidase